MLEAGQVLYVHERYGHGVIKHVVDRVTATQAVLKDGTRIRRQIHNSDLGASKSAYAYPIGGYTHYYLETVALADKYDWTRLNRQVQEAVRKLDPARLTKDQLHVLLTSLETVITL